MKELALLSCACIVLGACSESNVRPRSRIASSELVTCKRVTPTGSHMPRTVCTSGAQRAKDEQEGRATLEEAQRTRTIEDSIRDTMRRENGMRP